MKHVERYHSDHTPAQLFDLIADVEQYPQFVPWVVAAKVVSRRHETIRTELTMGTSVFNKRFTTIAQLEFPHRMEINSYDPLFERFQQVWAFAPTAEGGTDIEYRLDLELKSKVLQLLVSTSFAEGIEAMVKAYMRRADRVYRREAKSNGRYAVAASGREQGS
jgi:coenzyme Q-binding protein COQ10